jgi:hypothetical protein
MGRPWAALSHGYDQLGLDRAAGGGEVFRLLVLARIIEPASKLDSLRALEEAGIARCRMQLCGVVSRPCRPGVASRAPRTPGC